MAARFTCPLGTPIYGMQRKCTTHTAFKSSLPLPSRWPSSSTSPTSSSAWCGGGAWTLTTSPSPTWRPLGTCWAPAFLPCASAASCCSRAWVSESRPPPSQPTAYRQPTVSFRRFSYICTEMLSIGQWRTRRWSSLQRFIRKKSVTNWDFYRNAETTPTRLAQTAPSSWVSFQQCVQSVMNLILVSFLFTSLTDFIVAQQLDLRSHLIVPQLIRGMCSNFSSGQQDRGDGPVALCISDICSSHTGRFSDVGQICLSAVLNLHEKSGYVTKQICCLIVRSLSLQFT